MKLAIISDTHLPKGARRLPDECVARLQAADMILHAGDLSVVGVLNHLESIGPPIAAIHGNVDDAEVRRRIPAQRVVEAEDVRIGMVHDAGPAEGRLERLRKRFPETQAVVYGHSHIPLHQQADDGFQIFNPGSPTERRRQPGHTMGMGRVTEGAITFELIALD
jgi:putative phosphoesterase